MAMTRSIAVGILAICAACSSTTSLHAAQQREDASAAKPHFSYYDRVDHLAEIPTPHAHFGHHIGERFLRHAEVVAYVHRIAQASDRAIATEYGKSTQHRPLLIATVSSPDNLEDLEGILERNRRLSDPTLSDAEAQRIIDNNPAVVWLSFNVHGNEASCTDTAVQLLYELTAGKHEAIDAILNDTVIVIDPCLNPDGRERYVSFFDQRLGTTVDPTPWAAEHREPWPSGRPNHYLFDLNRDWVWGTQVESRARVAMYRNYLPQLHVDYHEQGIHSPYFFGTGDTPWSKNIPSQIKDWTDLYGDANAKAFDQRGFVWATKERFDYLYPGYGKVLPVYHGAVGLLCEQAGHGTAGLAIEVDTDHGPGLTLTLEQRIRHHFTTAMSYLETTATNRKAQLERFRAFHQEAMTPNDGKATAYLLDATTDPGRLQHIWDLCAMHGIEIHTLDRPYDGDLTPHLSTDPNPFVASKGTWVIRAGQRKGYLARTLFEARTEVEDTDTYDITSWTVPVMFGVRAAEFLGDPDALATTTLESWAAPDNQGVIEDGAVALLIPAGGDRSWRAMGAAARANLFARVLGDEVVYEFEDGPVTFPTGSLIVHKSRNKPEAIEAFTDAVRDLGMPIYGVVRTMPDQGSALGNNSNGRFIAPRVVLLRGEPLSSLSFGHTWHMLDVQHGVPHSVVNVDDMGRVPWEQVDTLVIPESWSMGSGISGSRLDELKSWIRGGGVVVALGRTSWWASESLVGIESDENVDHAKDGLPEPSFVDTYEQREALNIQRRVPGAMLEVALDTTHPMTSGIQERIGMHVYSGTPMPVGERGEVLARFAVTPSEDGRHSPFGGPAQAISGSIDETRLVMLGNTPAVTMHRVGGGLVICFASDPTNRGMNREGMRLLMNAIMLGPSASPSRQPLDEAHEDGH